MGERAHEPPLDSPVGGDGTMVGKEGGDMGNLVPIGRFSRMTRLTIEVETSSGSTLQRR